jgi:hypothetical protein
MARMSLRIQLGPLVAFQVEGESCRELAAALEGFDDLNKRVDAMCSDLAARVYPEGTVTQRKEEEESAS